ncbi:hypothetical protein CK203_099699 [Vitis vinifera]|uniref:Reverse transcriptase zinc-binding domain-containing protein n=1 Tax=Vitis vinifera TaxID=29760 RepID=A0A438FB65_VITVI|nr:hypothetical protein CK203_099699 [Vitis vinifera]
MWLRVEGFLDKIKEWCSLTILGETQFCASEEAIGFEIRLKEDSLERLGALSEEDRSSQRIVRDEFSHCAILEEISWRQKSRALWLKKGDSNTKFFHRMANARKRGNFISNMTIRGVRLDNEEELKEGIGSYFKSLFEESLLRKPNVECLRSSIRKNAVFRSLNATFLVLIPKKEEANDVQDFRPISLVGSLYKIIAKVLANRLKIVMGKVVLNSQNVFVEGANEAIDSRKRNVGAVVDLWGREGGGGGGWECTLEDPSKIGNWRRSLKDENSPLFLAKEVWGSYAPFRTRFFAWGAVWGKISTVDMLMRRGWSMVNRVVWVFPASMENLLLEWKIKGLGKKRRAVWRLAPICLFWCIWGERNRRTF